jgi:hypothetical protein
MSKPGGLEPSGPPGDHWLARAARATVPRSPPAPALVRHAVTLGIAALHRPRGCAERLKRCAACPPSEGGAHQRQPPPRRVGPLSLFEATRGRPATTLRAHACPPAPPLPARALGRHLRSSVRGGAGGAAAADAAAAAGGRRSVRGWQRLPHAAPPCALLRHVCCVAGLRQGVGIALIGCVNDGEGGELTVTCLCAVSGGQLGGAKCAALRAAAAARWLRRWRVCAQMLVAGRDLDTGVRGGRSGVFGAGATTWEGH